MKSFLPWLVPVVVFAISCVTPDRKESASEVPLCCATEGVPEADITDASLYQLESVWTNDADEQTHLGVLQGRAQVVAMFFANCNYACPIIIHDMKRIESALPETARAETGFTLITFDLARDTPEVLRAYRVAHQLPADRWTLLRGGADDTLELAALLGVKYKQEANGQFAHSNLITLLNREGEIIDQIVGLNQNIDEAVARLTQALAPPSRVQAPNE